MSAGGEVANALACKASIRGFDSRTALQLVRQLLLESDDKVDWNADS